MQNCISTQLWVRVETYIEFDKGPVEFLVVKSNDVSISVSVDSGFVVTSNCASRELDMGYVKCDEGRERILTSGREWSECFCQHIILIINSFSDLNIRHLVH